MAAYATVQDVQNRMVRQMSNAEKAVCATLLEDAAVLIDAYNVDASPSAKNMVSCRIVSRSLGDGSNMSGIPLGASQGSMSGLGYTQSWTMQSGGGVGELYLSRTEKKSLGVSAKIGSHSPVEDLICEV